MSKLETQISGKYSPENHPVYALKQKLENTGVVVNFPKGNTVTSFEQGFAITHPDEAVKPYFTTEIEFLRSVKENPVHIVCNIYQNENGEIHEGYIGESASIEVAYALTQNKPVVMLRIPVYSTKVPRDIQEIIASRQDQISVVDLDSLTDSEVTTELQKMIKSSVDYRLNDIERVRVMRRILSLSRGYKSSWNNYKSNQPE